MNRGREVAVGIFSGFLMTVLPLAAQQAATTAMAGTKRRVQFDNEVGTAISRVNDGVEVRLIKPVLVGGREVLPAGTTLSGRVLAVRRGDKHRKTYAMIRLGFNRVTLPDGRSFPAQASLANLGVSESVDSEGAASMGPVTKGDEVGVPVTTGATGAGIGAIAGGGKGAAEGAAIGAGVGILVDLAGRAAQWYDFAFWKGRKAWLRLDDDLSLPPPPFHAREEPDIQGPSAATQLPQTPATPPAAPAPPEPENKGVDADLTVPVATSPASPKPENKGVVYVEPAPKARFYRVNTEALLRDLNKAEVPLTINPSQADYLLRAWDDSHGFHAELTDHGGRIVWVGSAGTQGGLARGIVRYMRDHALPK